MLSNYLKPIFFYYYILINGELLFDPGSFHYRSGPYLGTMLLGGACWGLCKVGVEWPVWYYTLPGLNSRPVGRCGMWFQVGYS